MTDELNRDRQSDFRAGQDGLGLLVTDHKRIIPEVVLRHKRPEARKAIFDRYFKRYRKSKLVALAWWLILWWIGAHRIYLGQYKAAAIIFGLYLFVLAIMLGVASSGGDGGGFASVILGIYLIEGVLLYWNIGAANDKRRQRLKTEIETTPYVPLSQPVLEFG